MLCGIQQEVLFSPPLSLPSNFILLPQRSLILVFDLPRSYHSNTSRPIHAVLHIPDNPIPHSSLPIRNPAIPDPDHHNARLFALDIASCAAIALSLVVVCRLLLLSPQPAAPRTRTQRLFPRARERVILQMHPAVPSVLLASRFQDAGVAVDGGADAAQACCVDAEEELGERPCATPTRTAARLCRG